MSLQGSRLFPSLTPLPDVFENLPLRSLNLSPTISNLSLALFHFIASFLCRQHRPIQRSRLFPPQTLSPNVLKRLANIFQALANVLEPPDRFSSTPAFFFLLYPGTFACGRCTATVHRSANATCPAPSIFIVPKAAFSTPGGTVWLLYFVHFLHCITDS